MQLDNAETGVDAQGRVLRSNSRDAPVCLLHGAAKIYMPGLLLGVVVIAIFLACGKGYFRRTEQTFADLL